MTQEEKAKRYDVALENAKHYHSEMGDDIKCVLEECFSELRESEDEYMRNVAINACKYMVDNFENSTKQYEDAIIWLKKQGDIKDKLRTMLDDSLSRETKESWNKFLDEQKPVKIDECRAKMMFIWALEKVEERTNKGYKLTDNDKNSWWNDFKTYALSGNKGEQNHTDELVEQKHTWSREDEQNLNAALGYINNEHLCRWLKDAIHVKYDNPAWSEEDERILRTIISDGIRGAEFDMVQVDWLKSLKERYTWKPSDEQMEALKQAKTDACGKPYFNALASLYVNLKVI